MAKHDDDGVVPRDALGVPLTVGARVVYATARGGGLLQDGVITRVQPTICIRRRGGKVITLGTAQAARRISSARARRQAAKHHLGRILPA